MNTLGRKGRVLKWTGLVVSLLIATTLLASSYWWLSYYAVRDRAWEFHVRNGLLLAACGPVFPQFLPSQGWAMRRTEPGLKWRPRITTWKGGWSLSLPLWLRFLLVAPATVRLWWRDRRHIPHACCRCGYNLTGNASGVCPECGTEVHNLPPSETPTR